MTSCKTLVPREIAGFSVEHYDIFFVYHSCNPNTRNKWPRRYKYVPVEGSGSDAFSSRHLCCSQKSWCQLSLRSCTGDYYPIESPRSLGRLSPPHPTTAPVQQTPGFTQKLHPFKNKITYIYIWKKYRVWGEHANTVERCIFMDWLSYFKLGHNWWCYCTTHGIPTMGRFKSTSVHACKFQKVNTISVTAHLEHVVVNIQVYQSKHT